MALPNTAKAILSGKTSTQSTSAGKTSDSSNPYQIDPTLWYKALPYRFFLNTNSGPKYSVNLPIAPSNLQINTRMATTVIPTLYGIIEDHSNVRFYDIMIQGTTGMAPQYTSMNQEGGLPIPSSGRDSFSSSSISLGGFLPEVTNMIKQAKKIYQEISTDGSQVDNQSGIGVYSTGYYAFHQLYQFFLKYKNECVNGLANNAPQDSGIKNQAIATIGNALSKAKGGAKTSAQASPKGAPIRASHPLQFINYKDNQMYDVVPVGFTLVRSADNPMLYNYSIKLVAFNLRSASADLKIDDNAFNEAFKNQIGLNGLNGSTFSKFANKARAVSTVLSRIGITR
jgi:hypothetical protein